MTQPLLLCCVFFTAIVWSRQACADLDDYDEDLRWAGSYSDDDKYVITYSKVQNRADHPGDEALKHIRVEWRGVEADLPHLRCLKVRGRLVVDEREKVRPVDWFQGITVLLNVGPEPRVDWSQGFDADMTASNQVLLKPDGTFTVAISLSQAPRLAGKERRCQAGISLGKPDGRRMIYKFGAIPLANSITTLTVPAGPELDPTLQLINAASRWPKRSPDPTAIIKAVNVLQAIGKQKALDALRQYIAIAPDGFFDNEQLPIDPGNIDQGDYNIAFWIIRLLFEPAQAGMRIPRPMIGAAIPHPGKNDEGLWPLFPIEVVDDIPFMIAEGWNLGGHPQHPSAHIQWAERYGVIRDAPLQPADDPLAVADRLLSLPKSNRLKLRTDHIRNQAWQLVANLIPMPDPDPQRFDEIGPQQWDDLRRAAAENRIHWDEKNQAYAFGERRK
jgi:hypothetical protein